MPFFGAMASPPHGAMRFSGAFIVKTPQIPATPVPAAKNMANAQEKNGLFRLPVFPGAPIWRISPSTPFPL
ncbi:hypothetical protein [Janthinobacterium sp. J1-1]|uniref:hypothetical protein n=1 Tax=Janthinobacterium sp. J1-1 TaxID=3065910 RepID=UPI002811BFAE|nr:hypothetical protein [Janthinobacterium sp. J1-1]